MVLASKSNQISENQFAFDRRNKSLLRMFVVNREVRGGDVMKPTRLLRIRLSTSVRSLCCVKHDVESG